MISFEDFLLLPSKVVDPFNRFVSRIEPFIVMVEFCQVIGPKPLTIVSSLPNDAVSGVDMNETSIWLMSSDTVPGTVIVLENNQSGIYAVAYYFNLYDVRARAFQRNLCIAYLSSERPTKEILKNFSNSIKKLVTPILICNRRLFIRHVSDIVKFSDTVDESTLQQYYTLHGDSRMVPDVGRFNVVFEQTRLLRSRFLTRRFADLTFEEDVCVGHNIENVEEAEEIICSFRVPSVPLSPAETLTPCAYSRLEPQLREVLASLQKPQNSATHGGSLFCERTPIARLPRSEMSNCSMNNRDIGLNQAENGEETLKMISGHLGDVLFPLLSGEDLIVCGNEQRKSTVHDMLNRLSSVVPHASSSYEPPILETEPNKIGKGLGGLQCTRSETGKLARWRNIMDMNRCVLKTLMYDGSLLAGLNKKRKFPSDRSLILFVIAYLTNLCSLVYVCRYLTSTGAHIDVEKLDSPLSADDEKIVVNLLTSTDFERYHALKVSPSKGKETVKPSRIINL